MTDATERAAKHRVHLTVGFSSRRALTLAYARRLVGEGGIGTIRHIPAAYLQDWITDEGFPLVRCLDRDEAGSSAVCDIGVHILDLAQRVTGHTLTAVSALAETFVPSRPLLSSSSGLHASFDGGSAAAREPVTVDDAAVIIDQTDGGALATFDFERLNEPKFSGNTQPRCWRDSGASSAANRSTGTPALQRTLSGTTSRHPEFITRNQ